jgi:prolyl-tRNA editing enzyme YbaK/EbsC (Cys-tRNA(Pro) deacylase)
MSESEDAPMSDSEDASNNSGSDGSRNEVRTLSEAAQRVQDALRSGGFANTVLELDVPVRTAAAAAEAVGCTPAQIVKSLVFQGAVSGVPVLVVASGGHRVSETRLAALLGEPVAMGPAKFVREVTGFAIGGIPPIAHARTLDTIVDAHLLRLGDLWAAAGHPNSVFKLTGDELVRMTNGRVAEVAE